MTVLPNKVPPAKHLKLVGWAHETFNELQIPQNKFRLSSVGLNRAQLRMNTTTACVEVVMLKNTFAKCVEGMFLLRQGFNLDHS